jgi:hypothetical protein
MHKLSVSLELSSAVLSLDELERYLSVRGDNGSHSLGESPTGRHRPFKQTTLKKVCDCAQHELSATLQHIAVSLLPSFALCAAKVGADVALTIAIFHRTVTSTINLNWQDLEPFTTHHVNIQIRSYPCEQHSPVQLAT